ncbi:hypothetical protein B4144_2193 [Bacillus atrophaeus]|nr:hypothetical protein D068_cds29450 [Bacillus atrophaeus UCMB-5137]KYD01713.1 hypothetical protein B4144_2193 [Bacillus atrophaeus]
MKRLSERICTKKQVPRGSSFFGDSFLTLKKSGVAPAP